MVTSAAILLGLGIGGLGTSALVQYGPAPTHLVWWLLLGAFAVAAVAVLAIPETRPERPGVLASLRPRMAVPRQARGTFAVALPVMIAAPALSGFYLSLGPSLAAQVLRSPDLLWGGLVIFLVAGTGAAATVALRGVSGAAAMLAGCLALLAGAVMTLAAIETASAAAFLAGTAVAATGSGTAFFLAAYRILTALAGPDQRASLIAAIWVGCGSPTCPASTPCPSPSTPWPSSSRWRGASPKPRGASSRAAGESPPAAHSPAWRPALSAPAPSAPRSPSGSLPSA